MLWGKFGNGWGRGWEILGFGRSIPHFPNHFAVNRGRICPKSVVPTPLNTHFHGNFVPLPKKLGFFGTVWARARLSICSGSRSCEVVQLDRSAPNQPLNAVSDGVLEQDMPGLRQKFLLRPTYSHGIHNSRKQKTGKTKKGTLKDPEKAKIAGSYRQPLFASDEHKDPARERADIPPGGARSR
jgi:hypothetical protein